MVDLTGALSYASFFLVFATAYAIITLGLNLQWGYTGLFNVGVAGFVAIGAYTSALLTTPAASDRLAGLGLPVAVGILAAMAVTGLVGLLVGALALRLRQDYLAITTFGIAVTIQLVANNATPLTGGPFGVQFIPKPMQAWLGTGLPWTTWFCRCRCCCWPTWPSRSWSTAPGAGCCVRSVRMKTLPAPWASGRSRSDCKALSLVAC